jgi:hypothetical protein
LKLDVELHDNGNTISLSLFPALSPQLVQKHFDSLVQPKHILGFAVSIQTTHAQSLSMEQLAFPCECKYLGTPVSQCRESETSQIDYGTCNEILGLIHRSSN